MFNYRDSQGLFCQAAFQLSSPQYVLVDGVVPPQAQDFALPLVELCEIPVSPFLQPVEVPLDGITAFWYIIHSFQFGVICKLAEGTLCPIIQIVNEEIEQDWTQY
ncbi:cAMP-dependent protein kinase inhibitor alpha [Grus japonensis]|uniref:cAMP-dependent protein kinase inhibitor alpha n=1 Tax=Grus japonensis TaxID=30415 RepID=A0ABC9W8K4_GRUJA